MKINRFEVSQFKGVQQATINIADDAPGNVITLIGLNESGKTTVLEALASFGVEDKEAASLVGTVHTRSAQQDFIPKDKKAAFTGQIKIVAHCMLDEADTVSLRKHFRDVHLHELGKMNKSVQVTRVYNFTDSKYEGQQTLWKISFPLKTHRAKNYKVVTATSDNELWQSGVSHLRAMLPQIIYFPTFLFKFPDRIYLEGGPESEINPYYQKVMQDVLDSQGDGLSVERHIVDRVKRLREEFGTPANFWAHLMGLDEKSQIDAVLQKMSNEMSREIFGAWNQILGRDVSSKRIQVDWALDSNQGNVPYIQLSVIDGQSRYSLSERSLGFRWFFSFLLFTQFRRNRKDGSATIFLFDEPASNLHSKAQMKLLESFARIASGDTYIAYSTHSHYMVNPEWLEKAYIIDNKAINYDEDDEADTFAVRKTDIEPVKYRTFVGTNPTKTTYFQPVLDALDVAFSPLLRQDKALIVEGKFDFHPIEYFRRSVGAVGEAQIYPGNGAGGLNCLISLFRGWGVDFKVLLDDDEAGQREKKRYLNDAVLSEHEVATLGEISDALKGCTFEDLYREDVRSEVAERFQTATPQKRHYSMFFQELLATKQAAVFPETEARFEPVLQWAYSVLTD